MLSLHSWNLKGFKYPKKRRLFWNEVKENRSRWVWAIQEHHLDASSQRKQEIGRKLVFYGQSIGSNSGDLMIVDRDLELVVVCLITL